MKVPKLNNQTIDWSNPFLKVVRLAIIFKFLRRFLLSYSERKLYDALVENNPSVRPEAAKEETYYMVRSILALSL